MIDWCYLFYFKLSIFYVKSKQYQNNNDQLTNWSANSRTVLREKRRVQKLKRSSRDGPSSSMTNTL